MKKFSWIFALILALSLVFVFAGCGEEPGNPGTYDGSGPKIIDVLGEWMDILPGGEVVLTSAEFGVNFDRSGGAAVITKTNDGTLTITECTADYFGFIIRPDFFASAGVAAPFDITFTGKLITPGRLKICMAGGPYDTIKQQTAAGAADAAFEITGTVTATHLTANGADGSGPGVRIQSDGSSTIADFEITGIVVTKK